MNIKIEQPKKAEKINVIGQFNDTYILVDNGDNFCNINFTSKEDFNILVIDMYNSYFMIKK